MRGQRLVQGRCNGEVVYRARTASVCANGSINHHYSTEPPQKAKRKTKPIYNFFSGFSESSWLDKAGYHHMGNTMIIQDRQQTNSDPSGYRKEIKSSDQNWERHIR